MTTSAAPDSAVAVSRALFARASDAIPGGVNSPVRAFTAVGGTPRFMVSGHGPWLTDADGRRYVDLICSWGPMILGHAHPAVVDAVRSAAGHGLSFGAPTEAEIELAEAGITSADQLVGLLRASGAVLTGLSVVYLVIVVIGFLGHGWARILTAVMTGGLAVLLLLVVLSAFAVDPLSAVFLLVPLVLSVAGIILWFVPRASRWYASR